MPVRRKWRMPADEAEGLEVEVDSEEAVVSGLEVAEDTEVNTLSKAAASTARQSKTKMLLK